MASQSALDTVTTLGVMTSFALFAAPAFHFVGIIQNQSVGRFTPYPYAITLLNCVVWVCYGKRLDSPSMMTVNACGMVLSVVFVTIYICFVDGLKLKKTVCAVFVTILAVSGVAIAGFRDNAPAKVLGCAAAVTSSLMYFSPGMDVYKAYTNKNTDSLSLFMISASLLNSGLWGVYGLLHGHDPFIMYPNMVGFVAALIQLVVYIYYKYIYPVYHPPNIIAA